MSEIARAIMGREFVRPSADRDIRTVTPEQAALGPDDYFYVVAGIPNLDSGPMITVGQVRHVGNDEHAVSAIIHGRTAEPWIGRFERTVIWPIDEEMYQRVLDELVNKPTLEAEPPAWVRKIYTDYTNAQAPLLEMHTGDSLPKCTNCQSYGVEYRATVIGTISFKGIVSHDAVHARTDTIKETVRLICTAVCEDCGHTESVDNGDLHVSVGLKSH